DRIAVLTIFLRPIGDLGFLGHIFSWSLISMLVVFPAAFVSGIQFPVLVALLGKGQKDVGRQVGLAYAWNTGGAILGSLAGGFGLLPALTAPSCWRLCVAILAALGLVTLVLHLRATGRWIGAVASAPAAALALLCIGAPGPTAAFRHTPIGVGRVSPAQVATPQALRRFLNASRRAIIWEAEGVESSVAVDGRNSLSLLVNGKSDGNARTDAPNMVMSGLLGPLIHPDARRGMIVGMGTGTTAGWMATVPSMERVDVVELERAVLTVAQLCSAANRDALSNPKLHVHLGDAREVLLSIPESYDIIFSEPSNPYRAGVASLFTREYYEAVRARLKPRGIFMQWVQAYDIDNETIRSIYATLNSVFPNIQTWQVHVADFLLVASAEPRSIDVRRTGALISQEPFKEGLAMVWQATNLEGFLARYVGGTQMADAIADLGKNLINTDDQ